MDQPELGKKIAELRKAKGMTQEELVEKCNLNVRTLQRIESGEVTPRSYTIKIIFTTLDYKINDSSEIKQNEFSNTGFIISKWLEQFYEYVIDLFNLKTKTMKKISILTIMLSVVVLCLLTLTKECEAHKVSIADSQFSDKDSSNQTSLVFTNFSCENCFDDKDDLIGYKVQFQHSGVTVKLELIKLNKKTGEFKTGFITGKLLENKVELTAPKEIVNDGSVKLTADKIERLSDKILLKGNAKLTGDLNNSIEADEIVIIFR